MSRTDKTADFLIKVEDEYIRVHKSILFPIAPYFESRLEFAKYEQVQETVPANAIVYKTENIGRAIIYLNWGQLISAGPHPAEIVDLSEFSMTVVNCCLHYLYSGKLSDLVLQRIGFDGWCSVVQLANFLAVPADKFRDLILMFRRVPRLDNDLEYARQLYHLDLLIGTRVIDIRRAATDVASRNLNVDWLIECFRSLPTHYLVSILKGLFGVIAEERSREAVNPNDYRRKAIEINESRLFSFAVAAAFTRTSGECVDAVMEYFPVGYSADDFDRAYTGCAHYKFAMPWVLRTGSG